MKEAGQEEIENATEGRIKFHTNAYGVNMTTLLQTRRAMRSVKAAEAIKASPEFQKVARAPFTKGATPYDIINGKRVYWREVAGVPGFQGYKFAPRFAEELEDFTHGLRAGMGELSRLDAINRFSLNLFFWLQPFHGYNLTDMYLTTVAPKLSNPVGVVRDFGEAAKDVMLQRKPYMQYARAGGPLPGIKSAASSFNKSTLDVMGIIMRRNPLAFRQVTKELLGDQYSGGDPIQQFWKMTAEASRNAIYSYQDVLQLALQKSYERGGLTRAQAVEKIARTFPDERTPARVGDQRWIGQALQGQLLLDFPKFAYARLKGEVNLIKDLKGEDRAAALARLGIAFALYEVGRQIISPWLQQATGQENAKLPDFGYSQAFGMGQDLLEGKRTPGQVLQSTLSPGYGVQALDLARGVNAYLGKSITLPGESAMDTALDYVDEASYKLNPLQKAQQLQRGQITPQDLLWQQGLGVQFPSDYTESKGAQGKLKSRIKHGSKTESLFDELFGR